MRLYIAEKPKLGISLAQHLGILKQEKTHIKTKDGSIVAWCRGHILSQVKPDAYGAPSFPGTPESLPIIPNVWQKNIVDEVKNLYETIKNFVNSKEITEIINVGDAGREGQLIVDEVLERIGNKKPVYRLWLKAQNDEGFKKALLGLIDNKKKRNLYESALARERADWLVGMNMSRLASLIASEGVFSVGRVQTPVLNLIATRQKAIDSFVPVTYYVPIATVSTANGSFEAELSTEDRITDKNIAQNVVSSIMHSNIILKVSNTKEKKSPPLPWCLDSIQPWASKTIGIQPKMTLSHIQALYENGYVSYPRTDCEYYPEEEYPARVSMLKKLNVWVPEAANADSTIKTRAWNSSKITDHYALMPTSKIPGVSDLSGHSKQLYDAISRLYVAQFYGDLILSVLEVSFLTNGHKFSARGKAVLDKGWTVVWPIGIQETKLPVLTDGMPGKIISVKIAERQTSPPVQFTEGTIITAMKNIVRYIDDPVAKKYLADTDGLGRTSSRADLIPDLQNRGYLELVGSSKDKTLKVTEKGFKLLSIVPKIVKDPIMTALWERDLDSISTGKISLDEFLKSIIKDIQEWCNDGKKKIDVSKKWKGDQYSNKTTTKSATKSTTKTKPTRTSSKASKEKTSIKTVKTAATKIKKASSSGNICNKCGKEMIKRSSVHGEFLGCSGYPKCKNTAKINN